MYINEESKRNKQIMFISAAFGTFINANKSTRFKNMKSIIICACHHMYPLSLIFILQIPSNERQMK